MPLAPAKQPHHDGGASAGARSLAPPASNAYWNRTSPDSNLFAGVSRYPFMALEHPSRDRDRDRDRERERDHDHPHGGAAGGAIGGGIGGGSGHAAAPHGSIPQSMSLRSMVNSEPWDGDDDEGYTDSDEAADDIVSAELERQRERERERDRMMRERERDRDRSRERPPSSHAPIPPPPPAANGHGHVGDPVSLGYVTLEEARVLFDMFVTSFNPSLPVLDAIIHTHGTLTLTKRTAQQTAGRGWPSINAF